MKKEDLLKIAREKYPVGTKFRCIHTGKEDIIEFTDEFEVSESGCVRIKEGTRALIDHNQKWAEIISNNMYKGQIENFSPEIVEKLLYYQEKQGNKRDLSVFEKDNTSDKCQNGFKWEDTDEGDEFWDDVINGEHFDLFFEKYPKMKQYDYEVVHCETQEQWDFVTEKTGLKVQSNIFKKYGNNKSYCIDINCTRSCCDLEWYQRRNSLILSFQDWCAKFNHQFEEFKVGDWVVITKSDIAWCSSMNEFVGKCVQINELRSDDRIGFLDDNYWNWRYKQKHFRKALPHEIPQTYTLTSIGEGLTRVNIPIGMSAIIDVREANTSFSHNQIIQNPCQEIFMPSLQDVISVTKPKGLIVRTIEHKQLKQEIKLVPIKLSNHSRLKLK